MRKLSWRKVIFRCELYHPQTKIMPNTCKVLESVLIQCSLVRKCFYIAFSLSEIARLCVQMKRVLSLFADIRWFTTGESEFVHMWFIQWWYSGCLPLKESRKNPKKSVGMTIELWWGFSNRKSLPLNSFSGFCQDGGINHDICCRRIEWRFSDGKRIILRRGR